MTNSNQDSIYELKSMNSTKLNPKVLRDILVIAEKFPYDLGVTYLLAFMVGRKIRFCMPDEVGQNCTSDEEKRKMK